ncbi:MAG: ABC transporter family substrate-binding protein [Mycobacteriaceae bacterium]
MVDTKFTSRWRAIVLAFLVALLCLACTADPPPAVEGTDNPKTTPILVPATNRVVVSVDEIRGGFNPHLLSDQSPASSALATLTLPSAFRPVPNSASITGSDWVMDSSLLLSAEQVSDLPQTVVYKIRDEAQWTDGAPIAAEDFHFLWQQMIHQPGVIDPAGYQHIAEVVASSGGGKTVTVTMKSPYPAWRELFTNLLPSHIVKDIAGGFAKALVEPLRESGALFRIKSVDLDRDEVLLQRNDRFWGTPAAADEILLRRAGSASQLADSIRTADSQVAQVRGGDASFAQLSAIPEVRSSRILMPRTLQLSLNAKSIKLANVQVRQAVLGLLDSSLLAAVGAGSDGAAVQAKAQVLTPSYPNYSPTAPTPLTKDQARALLTQAGYLHKEGIGALVTQEPERGTSGQVTKDGEPLSLVIGAAKNDSTSIAVANTASDLLRSAGISASVLALDPEELYGTALLSNRIDAIVGWQSAGGDPWNMLASRFSCAALGLTMPGGSGQPLTPAVSSAPESQISASSNSTVVSTVETAPLERSKTVPSNITGVCDQKIDADIESAVRGPVPILEVLKNVEPKIWDLAVVLPILQESAVVAVGPSAQQVSLQGAPPVGIFSNAYLWTRLTQ